MTIIEKFTDFYQKKIVQNTFIKLNKSRSLNFNPIIFFSLILLVSIIFFAINNIINQRNIENQKNVKTITSSKEFSNLKGYLISKLNSPYKEIKYSINNNDSIEKILKKYEVRLEDVKDISTKLKRGNLSNIYSGRKLSMVLKKLPNGLNTLVNLNFPISNTTSIDIRKSKNTFLIKENILQLYKKEIVVKNSISNNLYSSAMSVNIEPNIIIEFARIFGLKLISKEIFEKEIGLKYIMKKFIDDNNKVRDTGKIIYASMYVNGEEINLYNFEYQNEEEYFDIKVKKYYKIVNENSNQWCTLIILFWNEKASNFRI